MSWILVMHVGRQPLDESLGAVIWGLKTALRERKHTFEGWSPPLWKGLRPRRTRLCIILTIKIIDRLGTIGLGSVIHTIPYYTLFTILSLWLPDWLDEWANELMNEWIEWTNWYLWLQHLSMYSLLGHQSKGVHDFKWMINWMNE